MLMWNSAWVFRYAAYYLGEVAVIYPVIEWK